MFLDITTGFCPHLPTCLPCLSACHLPLCSIILLTSSMLDRRDCSWMSPRGSVLACRVLRLLCSHSLAITSSTLAPVKIRKPFGNFSICNKLRLGCIFVHFTQLNQGSKWQLMHARNHRNINNITNIASLRQFSTTTLSDHYELPRVWDSVRDDGTA